MCRIVAALVVVGCMLVTVSALTQATERKEQDESKAPALLMPATESLPSYDGHHDRDGRGEGWWRYRAALLDAECLAAQLLAEELHVDYAKGKTLTDSTLAWREVEARRDQLPEEMRQAGGLPGWLRRGEPDWLDR